MECCCYLRHVQDLLAGGKTLHERRFGEPFKGPISPFGAMVEYQPISARDHARLHKSGLEVPPGIFLGYALIAGGTRKGDYLIAEIEELENFEASEILSPKIECTRSLDSSEKRRICITCGRWYCKFFMKRLRIPGKHSKAGTNRKERESHSEDPQGEAEESHPTESRDDVEAHKDFWSVQGDFIYRHHIEPRVKHYVPKEETFPTPLKYIDVMRSTNTDLDVAQEKRIDDYWNVDEDGRLSDSWTGFTKFTLLKETSPKRYMWSGRRRPKIQTTTRPDHVCP